MFLICARLDCTISFSDKHSIDKPKAACLWRLFGEKLNVIYGSALGLPVTVRADFGHIGCARQLIVNNSGLTSR